MRGKRIKRPSCYTFIDASNLFYGGEKSLGWKIDYKKLHDYIKAKYGSKMIFYFGGIETFGFNYRYLNNETVDLQELIKYLRSIIRHNKSKGIQKRRTAQIEKQIQKVKFYKKLQNFGFHLLLKPVKRYRQSDGTYKLKANCDLDMTLYMLKLMPKYDQALILTGDGDFLPVLKHLKHNKKKVVMLARGKNTAKELRQFAGQNFRDFGTLRSLIEL